MIILCLDSEGVVADMTKVMTAEGMETPAMEADKRK